MRQLLWVWMLLMALAFVNDRCHCCLQEERSGLLEIKAWFYELQGWDKEDLNCCNWDRVACDNTTNRVIELNLSYLNYGALEDLYLNASLFLPFKELETLDLSYNQLVGGLKNQGFQELASGLRKLKYLYLSDNKFNDTILSSLGGFSTLESLDLSNNSFTGTIGLRGGVLLRMRQLWVWMLLMALAFVNDRCHCCLQDERSGLLEIKAWFSPPPRFHKLQDWDKEDLNCCNWSRVACDNTTNRVIKLDLPVLNYRALGEKDLYLNASLFLPFKELEILDLSNNFIVGGLKNQGFQGLASGLRKLKELTLFNNKFNDSILSSLSGFSVNYTL